VDSAGPVGLSTLKAEQRLDRIKDIVNA